MVVGKGEHSLVQVSSKSYKYFHPLSRLYDLWHVPKGLRTPTTEILVYLCSFSALFTVARNWKWPKCPPTDKQKMKTWHIYTMRYYSYVKRNEIMQVNTWRWDNLSEWGNLKPWGRKLRRHRWGAQRKWDRTQETWRGKKKLEHGGLSEVGDGRAG